MKDSFLKEGKNCWRIYDNQSVKIHIDAQPYFNRLHKLFLEAKEQIIILGWDIDTRILLNREEENPSAPLGKFLKELIGKNHKLQIHILCWEFAPLYFLEREFFQKMKLGWPFQKRIQFVFDDQHPFAASHHQKIVVIDDAFGFCGGIDLTKNRWDTKGHLVDNPFRKNPSKESFQPFHDVQVEVSGDTAQALGELARERWRRATGKILKVPSNKNISKETQNQPDAITTAVARTLPSFKGYSEVREVESLYIDSIANAEKYIYIENQYITSRMFAKAISQRLQQKDCPEIVIIVSKEAEGIVEKETIFNKQNDLLGYLSSIDKLKKLHIYYPKGEGLPKGQQVKIHSKVMVIDDRYIRIGSSNLNNRSMGLDTECDIILDTKNSANYAREFATKSIAHFLDIPFNEFSTTWSNANLASAIDKLNSNKLGKLNFEIPFASKDKVLNDIPIGDLDKPASFEQEIEEGIYEKRRYQMTSKTPLGLASTVMLSIVIAYLWAYFPINENINEIISHILIDKFSTHLTINILSSLIFIFGAMLFLPINLLIILTASILEVLDAFYIILISSIISSILGYVGGYSIGEKVFNRYVPQNFKQIKNKFENANIATIAFFRFTPIAPFNIINFISGVLRLPMNKFFLGTTIALVPRVIGIILFQKQLIYFLKAPSWFTGSKVLIISLAIGIIFYYFHRRLSRSDISAT